jgi:uncharacterized protein (UPF0262 family)
MGNLADLRIDEPLWASGTPLRQAEWRSACVDLLADCNFSDALDGGHLLVTKKDDAIAIEALDDDGYAKQSFTVTKDSLAAPIAEYVSIIRRLDDKAQDRSTSWFEAVDMAKKVVHDHAAKILAGLVPELSTDLPTLRRLFTLLLSLWVDTTTLHHARGHGFRRSDTKASRS